MDSPGSFFLMDPLTIGPAATDPHLRLHSVKVFVRDQDRSLRFYLDRLGFHQVYDARLQSGERWVAVAPPERNAILALVEPRPGSEECDLIGSETQIAFVTDDVPAKFRQWSSRGVKFRGIPRLRRMKYQPSGEPAQPGSASPMLLGRQNPIWGGVFTRFEDIDGNVFSLVSFDEVSQALELQRRAIAEREEYERRLARELEIAREVQARLFPQSSPSLNTLDYHGLCVQTYGVGGDYYDFLDLGRNKLGLIIGDIAGKGIAAALLMANLQANLRSQCTRALDEPRRLLGTVNQLFHENTSEAAYATLFYGEYDDETGCLRYVNCGHLPALLLRSDNRLERLESTATVLGLFREWDCSVGQRQLFEGDILALYSDGITESVDEEEREYGESNLTEALKRHRKLAPQDLLNSIVDDVRKFSRSEQHDDITLIVARCRQC